MIPKIIHYCWFGNGKKPNLTIDCINTWRKLLPDYEIIEWNESNFDVNSNVYTKEAYEEKKYAFVSDYARFFVLYHYGGIYLDTDVELLKSLNDLLHNEVVLGFEREGDVAPGLICASIKGHNFIKDMMNMYEEIAFREENGLNLTTVVEYTTNKLVSKGLERNNQEQLIEGIHVFPTEYFCPIDMDTNEMNITSETYTIHHFASSWLTPWGKFKKKVRIKIGPKRYEYLHKLKLKISSENS